ncbi:MAG: hypothetical protein A2Z38_06095 [Planctomycetes bacterium RBG_19FT_COMBO_48_8]|nr:MAG: hypothetical protein A2Z38_06095 [Planctomycetes bacterium RBG_19FT_COMBO_48_8]
MVATKQQALEIAGKAREDLNRIYGKRLRGVYLYGSAARDQLTPTATSISPSSSTRYRAVSRSMSEPAI